MKQLVFHLINFLTFLPYVGMAQSISPSLITTGGGITDKTQIGYLEWSIGEPMVESYNNGEKLTQGFHQVYVYTLLTENTDINYTDQNLIKVFPNPATQLLQVQSTYPVAFKLINFQGREVINDQIMLENHIINTEYLSTGLYLLLINQKGNNNNQIFKIQIIH